VFRAQMEFLDQLGIFKFVDYVDWSDDFSGLDVFELTSAHAGRIQFQVGKEIVFVIALNDVQASCTQTVSDLPDFVGRIEAGFCSLYAPGTNVASNWKSNGPRSMLCIVMQESWYTRVLVREAPAKVGVDGTKVKFRSASFHPDSILANLANAIRLEMTSGRSGDSRVVASIAESCLMHAFRNHTATGQVEEKMSRRVARPSLSKDTLDRIDDFIHKNLAGYVTVDAMAEVAHISKFHFIRSFRRATGYTPYEYLIHCRVNKARELLALNPTRTSLAEVASDVGFYDQSHLNRHFKQIVGMTPKQFALSVQRAGQAAD
jgi:AraC-like DNA-binding protein